MVGQVGDATNLLRALDTREDEDGLHGEGHQVNLLHAATSLQPLPHPPDDVLRQPANKEWSGLDTYSHMGNHSGTTCN